MGFKNPACVKEITNIRYGGVMSEPTIYIIVFPTYINKKRRQKIPQCYSKKCYTHVPRRLCFEVPKLHLTLGLASLNLIQVWRSHHGCRLLWCLQSYKVQQNRIKNMHLKKETSIDEEKWILYISGKSSALITSTTRGTTTTTTTTTTSSSCSSSSCSTTTPPGLIFL